VGGSWRCDETYIKVKGRWTYLYRAVDKQGRTVDFLLSEHRDVAAAKAFFRKAMKSQGTPRVITLDAYAASHRAIAELKAAGSMPHRVRIRCSKYLNNVVEQDHRRIKHRIRSMLGFKQRQLAKIMADHFGRNPGVRVGRALPGSSGLGAWPIQMLMQEAECPLSMNCVSPVEVLDLRVIGQPELRI